MEEKFLNKIYNLAVKAYKKNEVPVGAIIVKNNKIISKGYNKRQTKKNLFGHAEIECIIKAERKLKDWRLDDCNMYVTLKPCEMCQIFIKESRLNNVYYIIDKDNTKKNISNLTELNINNDTKQKNKKLLNLFFENIRK